MGYIRVGDKMVFDGKTNDSRPIYARREPEPDYSSVFGDNTDKSFVGRYDNQREKNMFEDIFK